MGDGPVDSRNHVAGVSEPVTGEHTDVHKVRAWGDTTGKGRGVARCGDRRASDDSGDVGAVSEAIDGLGIVLNKADAGSDLAQKGGVR